MLHYILSGVVIVSLYSLYNWTNNINKNVNGSKPDGTKKTD